MANLDAFQLKFHNPDEKQLRIFISNINNSVGQSLVETLRNDYLNDEAHHLIIGTLDPFENNPLPRGISHTIDNKDLANFTKTILDCDIIIYDLMKCALDEVEYVIKLLKLANYTDEKLLICISSVMTWALCREKTEKNDDFLTEEDRVLRKTYPKYQFLLSIEDQILQINNIRPNLRAYCLVSGLQYGNGEDLFFPFFKQAWLLDPYELPVFSDGKNIMPMIHVKDLAEYVFHVIHRAPPIFYIFAVDFSEGLEQKSIVQEISRNFGSGLIKPKPTMEAVLDENFEIIRINLKIRPNHCFEEENDGFSFRWWCKEGFLKNMDKVCNEFIEYRGLRTNKILIAGPPAVGKTHYGKQLAKQYNIPHILLKETIDALLKQDNELSQEIHQVLKDLKDHMIEEEQARIDLEKKKNKNKKGWVEPVLDTEKLIPRVPEPFLYKIYQWRLSQNDCKYRGYVLDGFPRGYDNAVGIFAKDSEQYFIEEAAKENTKKSAAKPGEKNAAGKGNLEGEPTEYQRKFELFQELAPESVVLLQAGDEFLKERCKNMGNAVIGTHYNEEGMLRRLLAWHRMNEENGKNLGNFFKSNEFECFSVNIEEKKPEEETYKEIIGFIERKGSFKTYNSRDIELELEKIKEEELEKLKEQELLLQKEKENALRLEEERINKEKESEQAKIQALKDAENAILDIRSQPLRQYLADCVIPYLTEGLIQIYKGNPENPLEFLGDYLIKKSEEIDLEHVQKVIKKQEEEKKKVDESP